jgi:hypothetical protein
MRNHGLGRGTVGTAVTAAVERKEVRTAELVVSPLGPARSGADPLLPGEECHGLD